MRRTIQIVGLLAVVALIGVAWYVRTSPIPAPATPPKPATGPITVAMEPFPPADPDHLPTPRLSPPVSANPTAININWIMVPGATSYEIEREGESKRSITTDATAIFDKQVIPDAEYTYSIRAVSSTNKSPPLIVK